MDIEWQDKKKSVRDMTIARAMIMARDWGLQEQEQERMGMKWKNRV
jgi:hypothetical protein